MKIIINLKGFTLAYQIMVVNNDNITFMTKASVKNIPEVVSELAHRNNCPDIVIYGSKNFTANIGENIKNTFSTKFNKEEPLKIEYVIK